MTHAIVRPEPRVHGALYVKPEIIPGTDQPELTFDASAARTWPSAAEAGAAWASLLARGYRVVRLAAIVLVIGP